MKTPVVWVTAALAAAIVLAATFVVATGTRGDDAAPVSSTVQRMSPAGSELRVSHSDVIVATLHLQQPATTVTSCAASWAPGSAGPLRAALRPMSTVALTTTCEK